jgi:hypothetical protein
MATKIKVKNGPAVLTLEEVVIGSQMTPITIHLREETSPGSGIMQDMDLSNKAWAVHVKDNLKSDVEPDVEITAVARTPLTGGLMDLTLDGEETTKLLEKLYYGSVKIWPAGSPELGTTVMVIELPVKYEATR